MSKVLVVSFLVLMLAGNSLCCISGKTDRSEAQPSAAVTQPAVVEITATQPLVKVPTEVPSDMVDALPGISIYDTQIYTVRETVLFQNEGPGDGNDIELYLALPRTITPLQARLSMSIDPPDYTIIVDEYLNEYAYLTIPTIKAGEMMTVTAAFRMAVNGIRVHTGDCIGELPQHDTGSEQYLEADAPQVMQLSSELAAGKPNACAVSRSIYDYVRQNMHYDVFNPGSIGALQTLQTMSGDCTEYADLMIALSRAAGIPAQYVDGVTCCTENGYVESENKHNWALTYLPSVGWVPMDPTWGKNSASGDAYFAAVTPDHIIVSQGRSLDTLNGYHFYYYYYRWGNQNASLNADETWSILPEP